jgi:hypothetical protein
MEAAPGVYRRIDADTLRLMLGGRERSRADDEFARGQRDALIVAALEDGRDVLLEDSTFDRHEERHLRELVRSLATLEVIRAEPIDASGAVPVEHEPPPGKKERRRGKDRLSRPRPMKYDPDPHLPPAVICDLDGTLALIHGRSPYDAARCERDELNTVVAGILRALVEPRPAVLLVSGREERYREQTVRWLTRHNIEYNELHMRPTGDYRKDTVIKREIFEREIRHRYRIEFVLDDRNQVVEMWRSLGLTCLQVAEGDF